MAKNKKKRVTGSRVTPRKDARKLNREYMKEAFALADRSEAILIPFESGLKEIEHREDVPADAIVKMKAFLNNTRDAFTKLITEQDADACVIEGLLNNKVLKWTDIELELTALQVGMQTRAEVEVARMVGILGEAAELALLLPDDVKPTSLEDKVKNGTVKDVVDHIANHPEVKEVEVGENSELYTRGENGELQRIVSDGNETIEVDPSALVLPKETAVSRDGAVAKVDADGELLPIA